MDGEAMREVMDKALASVGVQRFGNERGIAVVPEGFSVRDIREMLPPPDRPVERVELYTAASFAEYVKRFGMPLETVIFADEMNGRFCAVIDYHFPTPNGTLRRGHCDHQAVFNCPPSLQWRAWATGPLAGKLGPQADFARFIEQNLVDIVSPPAAEMLQVALTLQVKKDVQFASDLRLDNGQTQFRYEETVRGSARTGDMQIPDRFTINIPVFQGGAVHPIEAWLRYRLDGNKLVIGYELVRGELVRQAAIQLITAELRRDLPDVPFYLGKK